MTQVPSLPKLSICFLECPICELAPIPHDLSTLLEYSLAAILACCPAIPPSQCFFLQPSTAEGVFSLGPNLPQGRKEGGVSFLLANTASFKPCLAPFHTKNKTNKKNLKTGPSEFYVLNLYHLLPISSLSHTDFLSFSILAYFLMTSTSMWMTIKHFGLSVPWPHLFQ